MTTNKRKTPMPTFADIAMSDLRDLELLVQNLLVNNKNHLSGFYKKEYSTSRFITEVLADQMGHINDRVSAVCEDLMGMATELDQELSDLMPSGHSQPKDGLSKVIYGAFADLSQHIAACSVTTPQHIGKSMGEFVTEFLPVLQDSILVKVSEVKLAVVGGFSGTLSAIIERESSISNNLLGGSMETNNDVEFFIGAAKTHGEDSDPDHEVGDLQDMFRIAWGIMTPAQKIQFATSEQVSDVIEGALPSEDYEEVREQIVDRCAQAVNSDSKSTFHDKLIANFPGFVTDSDVNGADLVDFVSNNLAQLQSDTLTRKMPRP